MLWHIRTRYRAVYSFIHAGLIMFATGANFVKFASKGIFSKSHERRVFVDWKRGTLSYTSETFPIRDVTAIGAGKVSCFFEFHLWLMNLLDLIGKPLLPTPLRKFLSPAIRDEQCTDLL